MSRTAALIALLCVPMVAACAASDTETADTGATSKAESIKPVFTHKMMKGTGENTFASLGYECDECTFEQHMAIEPPTGWTKGPSQVGVFSSGQMRSRPSFDGVPDAMDFVAEVPGKEYELIVKNLNAEFVGQAAGGIVVKAHVMRDTLLRFDAGRRVHEVTDPDGDVFVLFAHGVDPKNPAIPDFQDPKVLGDFTPPTGWSYSSRILSGDLLLDCPDTTHVLAFRGKTDTTWELRK